MGERLLEIDNVAKQYRLGMIGGGTLRRDLTSWYARVRGREDPNRKIGYDASHDGEWFMALESVSFTADRGDAIALLGRNGAGKSTMLKLISRITAPSAGEIRIHGNVASLLEVGTGFHPELTGRENIYLNGAILGMSRTEITRKLPEIIEFSEIEQFIDTPVKRYSSGMHVKLGFAVAANLAPDVLICDEVLAVGDLNFQQKCLSKMNDVARSGRAVLYVSHNMRTVIELCNRALFLDSGHLLYDGTVERAIELYSGAGNRNVERDLDALPRPRQRGESMRMLHMTVLNSNNMEFEQDSEWRFRLRAVAHIPETNLRLRMILANNMLAPVAMTQTCAFDVSKDETFTLEVAVSLAGLAPGEYTVRLTLVADCIGGGNTYYDSIEDAGQLVINDDPAVNSGFSWQARLWGNMRMQPLSMARVPNEE